MHSSLQSQVILVTGACHGIGPLTAGALAQGGHIVYAAIDGREGSSKRKIAQLRAYAREYGVDIRPLHLDPMVDRSVDTATDSILRCDGRIDVVVHNSLKPIFGPAEAFSAKQVTEAFDHSITGAHRIMRAVLPHMRLLGGLVVWVASSGAAGGAAPYLAIYCSIAAALEAMATQYARELAPFGIETSIVMPGLYGRHSNPFESPLKPADGERFAAYELGPTRGLSDAIQTAFSKMTTGDTIPGAAAGAIAMVVDSPTGERPFRLHVDHAHDGAEIILPVMDRVRDEMIRRLGLTDRLSLRIPGSQDL